MATVSLLIQNDDIAEFAEEFNMKILQTSHDRVMAGPENVAKVTIVDSECAANVLQLNNG